MNEDAVSLANNYRKSTLRHCAHRICAISIVYIFGMLMIAFMFITIDLYKCNTIFLKNVKLFFVNLIVWRQFEKYLVFLTKRRCIGKIVEHWNILLQYVIVIRSSNKI